LLDFVLIGLALNGVKGVDRDPVLIVDVGAVILLVAILYFVTEELAIYVGETLAGLLKSSFGSFAYASHFVSNIYWKSMHHKLLKVARKIRSCGQLSVCILTLPFLLASAQPIEDVSGLAKTQSGLSAKTWVSIGCIALWAVGILGAALTLQYNTSVNMGWLTLSGAFALTASFAWLMLQSPDMNGTTDPFYLVLATSHMFIMWFISQPSDDTDRKTLLGTTFLGFATILLIVGASIPTDGANQADPTLPSGGVDMITYAVNNWAPSPIYFIVWAILVRTVFYCFGHYFRDTRAEEDAEDNAFELQPAATQFANASSVHANNDEQVDGAGSVAEASAT
jgi:hypothetical protein